MHILRTHSNFNASTLGKLRILWANYHVAETESQRAYLLKEIKRHQGMLTRHPAGKETSKTHMSQFGGAY